MSRYLSLTTAGSFTHAAFGSESAGGDGSPASDVCQKIPSGSIAFVTVHPGSKAGGVTPSNVSERIRRGLHVAGAPFEVPCLLNTEEAVAANATKAIVALANAVARLIDPLIALYACPGEERIP